jgi:hypothetical protein
MEHTAAQRFSDLCRKIGRSRFASQASASMRVIHLTQPTSPLHTTLLDDPSFSHHLIADNPGTLDITTNAQDHCYGPTCRRTSPICSQPPHHATTRSGGSSSLTKRTATRKTTRTFLECSAPTTPRRADHFLSGCLQIPRPRRPHPHSLCHPQAGNLAHHRWAVGEAG